MATAYYRRLDILANIYREDPVLAALPLCIKGLVAAWFNSIEPDVVEIIIVNVDNFNAQLLQRFNENASYILKKADAIKHSFENETDRDV
jgi:hypothetical protein